MKLETLQENFTKALLITSRFVSARAQLPVLANILLSAKKTKLTISSTNLEISASIGIGAKIKEEGELTIPARVISEIVSNLSPGSLSLESSEEILKLSSSNFSSKISGMNSNDFPKVPQSLNKAESLVLPKKELLEAFSQVSFAVSTDEARPILTGVLFLFTKEGLKIVATDGFRLSQKKINLKNTSKVSKFVLPKNIILELSRIESEGEEFLLEVKEKENQALFAFDELVLSSRVLDGEYPDFEKIIPKSASIKVRVDKEEFLRIVKLSSVFARDSANIVKVKVLKNSLKLSAESSQAGNQEGTIDAKVEGTIPPGEFDISFNYKFLEDFLRVVSGEEILMEFNDASSPGVFTDLKDPNFLHLIMPVKIQG